MTIAAGDRLLRAVPVTDATPTDALTASVSVATTDGQAVSSSPATVETGPDGTTRALIDQTLTRSGTFTLTLAVCRADACTRVSFAVKVPEPNARPAAEVTLTSSDATPQPTSTLTATPTTSDPEHDPVTLAYAWTRNGVAIAGQAGAQLALTGIAQPGDIIAVTVTPADAGGAGHAASADLLVHEKIVPPPPPTITATAKKADGTAYPAGTWSTKPVTVTFTCTAGSTARGAVSGAADRRATTPQRPA